MISACNDAVQLNKMSRILNENNYNNTNSNEVNIILKSLNEELNTKFKKLIGRHQFINCSFSICHTRSILRMLCYCIYRNNQ